MRFSSCEASWAGALTCTRGTAHRRCFMLAMGTKLEVVSRVLGHSSVTVTADVYSHLLGGEKRAAAAAITAVLFGPDVSESRRLS